MNKIKTITLPNGSVYDISPNDGTLTIKKNGVSVGSFSADAAVNEDIDITVPTKVSELTNDVNYLKSADLKPVATSGNFNDLTNKPEYNDTAVTGQYVSKVSQTNGKVSVTRESLPTLSKGSNSTDTKTLAQGGTFTAVTKTSVNDHQITDTVTTFTLPAETVLTKGTATGTGDVVTDITLSGHQIALVKGKKIPTKLADLEDGGDVPSADNLTVPDTAVVGKYVSQVSETKGKIAVVRADLPKLSKGTDTTNTKTLAHGGTFTAVTMSSVDDHKITNTVTTFTMPDETELSMGAVTGTGDVVTDVTVSNHQIKLTKGKTIPTKASELTNDSNFVKTTDLKTVATTGSFNDLSDKPAVTDTADATKYVSKVDQTNGKITVTRASLPTLSKAANATGTPTTLAFGGTMNAVTDSSVSDHTITNTVTTFTLPSETELSLGTQVGTGDVVTGVAVSGHTVTVTKAKTMPVKVSELTNDSGFTDNEGTLTGISVNGTSVATTGVANITQMPAAILDGIIPQTVTGVTADTDDNSTKLATTAFVQNALSGIDAMQFRGTLGTGGTITALPIATAATKGYTYKVIEDGTYSGMDAGYGSLFISDGTAWVLIPAGDSSGSGSVSNVGIKANAPLEVDNTAPITTTGTRTLSHKTSGVSAGTYTSVTVDTYGHVTAATNPTTLSGYGITDAVANTVKVNGKALSGDITLTADDIGAVDESSVVSTYSATGTDAISGKGVAAALSTLTVAEAGASSGKYIAAISQTDGKISATAGTIDSTYSATGTNPVNGKAVAAAITDKADKASITAGTAGPTAASTGAEITIPYVTMTAQGIVSAYGTRKHTITVTPTTVDKFVAANATGGGSVTAGTAAACTLPTLTMTVGATDETLTFAWTDGSFTANKPTEVTLPSFATQTIVTDVAVS